MDIKKILESLIPFVLMGIAVVIGVTLLMMFFYIAIWGIIIGGILWLGVLAKQYFFPSNTNNKQDGRVIEHDDGK